MEVPLPVTADRLAVLKVHTASMTLGPDVSLPSLAADDCSGGLTCAELATMCREAGMLALREDINATCVAARHFTRRGSR